MLAATLLSSHATAPAQKKQAANQKLAAEIDDLLLKDIRAQTPNAAIHARVREIFAEHGVPSDELVGNEAAEEYVALLSGEPLPFLQTVLPKIKQAAEAGKISQDSYIYLKAAIRRKEIRQKFTGPPANPELQAEIERLIKADQGVRPIGHRKWDLKKMEATDRADGIRVRAILAKYGLPTFALVGPEAAEDFATVIQHQPLSLEKEVLPKMKAKAEEGQISSESYAKLLDRVDSYSHQPQTYGENFVCTPDGKAKPSAIADPQNVDRRRAELGLVPLAVYAKALGDLYMNNMCAQIAAENKKAAHHKPGTSH